MSVSQVKQLSVKYSKIRSFNLKRKELSFGWKRSRYNLQDM